MKSAHIGRRHPGDYQPEITFSNGRRTIVLNVYNMTRSVSALLKEIEHDPRLTPHDRLNLFMDGNFSTMIVEGGGYKAEFGGRGTVNLVGAGTVMLLACDPGVSVLQNGNPVHLAGRVNMKIVLNSALREQTVRSDG